MSRPSPAPASSLPSTMPGSSLSRPRSRSVSKPRLPILRALALAGLAVLGLVLVAMSSAGVSQADDAAPSWSPSGRTIAFASRLPNGNWQIYTVNAGGGSRRTLTHGALDSVDLSWSPSGKQIAFSRIAGGQLITGGHVYVMNAGGGSERRLTSGGGGYDELFDWSPDGKMLAFDRLTDGIGAIYVMNANGSGLKKLTPSPSDDDYWGVWS